MWRDLSQSPAGATRFRAVATKELRRAVSKTVSIPRRGYAVPRQQSTFDGILGGFCLNPPQGLRGSAPRAVAGPVASAPRIMCRLNPPQGLRGSAPLGGVCGGACLQCLNPPQGLRGSAPLGRPAHAGFGQCVSIPRRGYAVPRLPCRSGKRWRWEVLVSIPRRGYAVPRRCCSQPPPRRLTSLNPPQGLRGSAPINMVAPEIAFLFLSQSPAGATRFRAPVSPCTGAEAAGKLSQSPAGATRFRAMDCNACGEKGQVCLNPPQGLRGSAPSPPPPSPPRTRSVSIPRRGYAVPRRRQKGGCSSCQRCLNPPQGLRGSAPEFDCAYSDLELAVSIPRRGYAVPRPPNQQPPASPPHMSQSPAGATRFRAALIVLAILAFVMSQSPAGATRFRARKRAAAPHHRQQVSIPRRGYAVPRRWRRSC